MSQPTIWVIDDDTAIRWVLERALSSADLSVASFESAELALAQLNDPIGPKPDAVMTDIRMPGIDGLALLGRIRAQHPQLPVIVMTAHSDLDSAVAAYEGGAFEYLPKPFDVDEAVELARRALRHANESQQSQDNETTLQTPEIIGEAPAMQEVFRAIGRLTRSHVTVLINGESGTGKELVAQALHRHSLRAQKPFIAINTAAIPRDLLEAELFGHEKGSFTGASGQRKGRFEQANGGTLFLDEIGDMPADLQTRLLRVLADGEFYRIGGHTPVKVDVRIIAATHQDMEAHVQQGHFREDLFHRLNVIRIHIPPLRERREDIPTLLSYFLQRAADELGGEPKILKTDVEKFLSALPWPGNVRQMENICRWLTVMAASREVHLEDLPPELRSKTEAAPTSNSVSSEQSDHATGGSTEAAANDSPPSRNGSSDDQRAIQDIGQSLPTQSDPQPTNQNWQQLLKSWAETELANGSTELLNTATPNFERVMIAAALQHTGNRRQDAARVLGWGRNTLTRKIKELEL